MQPTAEEFQAWREHPVSQWVFQAVRTSAQAQKAAWDQAAWDSGKPDPLLLTELRTRADALNGLHETTYERWCELHGAEPKGD